MNQIAGPLLPKTRDLQDIAAGNICRRLHTVRGQHRRSARPNARYRCPVDPKPVEIALSLSLLSFPFKLSHSPLTFPWYAVKLGTGSLQICLPLLEPLAGCLASPATQGAFPFSPSSCDGTVGRGPLLWGEHGPYSEGENSSKDAKEDPAVMNARHPRVEAGSRYDQAQSPPGIFGK